MPPIALSAVDWMVGMSPFNFPSLFIFLLLWMNLFYHVSLLIIALLINFYSPFPQKLLMLVMNEDVIIFLVNV